jgi:hypothetical protein
MTKEEWRNLTPGTLVTISTDSFIYKVVSTGWEDMEEKDFKDDDDYIIEVKDIFDCFDGQFVVRAHQTALFNYNIPTDVFEAAKNAHNPYDFISGFFYFIRKIKRYVINED